MATVTLASGLTLSYAEQGNGADQTFAELLEYDDTAELAGIGTPTLLIWGDADTLVSRQMQDQLTRSIRDAELLVYAEVGHTPRWEDPARFRSDLVTFVRGVALAEHLA